MDTPTRGRARAAIAAVGAALMMLALLPATSFAQDAPACDDPEGKGSLNGSIVTVDGQTVTALVNTSGITGDECTIVVLSTYELPGDSKQPYSEQRLFSSSQPIVVTADTEDFTLELPLPSCNFQIDLYITDAQRGIQGDNEQGAPHHGRLVAGYQVGSDPNPSVPCGPPAPSLELVCPDGEGTPAIEATIDRITYSMDIALMVSGQGPSGATVSFDGGAPVTRTLSADVPGDGSYDVTVEITPTGANLDDSNYASSTVVDGFVVDCTEPTPTSTPIPTPEPVGARASSAAVCDVDGDAVVRYQVTLEDATEVDVSITDTTDTVVFTDTLTTSGLYVADLDDALLGTTVTVTLTPDVGDPISTDVLIDDTDCTTPDVTEVLGEEVESDPEPETEPVTEVEDEVVVNPQVDEEPEELAQTGLGALQLLILGAGAALTGASGLVATRKRD